jgi:hypothetical protein
VPFNKGKFRSTVDAHHNPSAGEKASGEKNPAKSSPTEKGKPPMEGHGTPPQHVTQTHPGMTQPHPQTGVHAVHTLHKGGGKYETQHHNEDGTVEQRQHSSAEEAHQSAQESLPGDSGQMHGDQNEEMGGQDFSETLGGIGGGDSY